MKLANHLTRVLALYGIELINNDFSGKQVDNVIKTHGSESRGQEEAAYMRVFWPTRPLQ